MLDALFAALRVRPDERNQVTLLLLKGFFIGSFLATYQVGAETLFLNRLPEYLEEALVLSGLLGVITTASFSMAQGRISYNALSIINLVILTVYTTSIYLGYVFLPGEYQDIVIFIMFAMLGPVTAVVLLGFWGVFGRLFDLRQSKRIIGWIDSGQLLAAITTFFLIPVLEDYIGATENLFIGSSVSLLLSLIFLGMLLSKNKLKQGEMEESSKEARGQTSLSKLFKSGYIKILSAFILFSMMSFIIIQYAFQNTITHLYPNEEDLRTFIAFFEAFILIFMLILQTFVNDKLISEYGIKVALLIMPILLLFFVGLAIFVGLFFSTDPLSSTYLYFFLAIALIRLFSKALRDALESPTFKLYFMPLDNRYRFSIQTKVEGVVNESSRFLGAVLIIVLSFIPFVQTIHIVFFLIFLLVGYIILIGKMYSEYRNQITIKLEDTKSKESLESSETKVVNKLQSSIYEEDSNKVIFSFKLLEKIDPILVGNNVNKIMNHHAVEVRDYAQARINEIKGLSVSEKYIINYDPDHHAYKGRYIVTGIDLEELLTNGDISQRRILQLSKSINPEDRLYAAELIINSLNEENNSILIELLSDSNFNVRIVAIKAAQQKYTNEVINALIGNLLIPTYSNQAADALVVIGSRALFTLDAAFYKSGQSTFVMIKIVQIMGKIGGDSARNMLWNKVDYPVKIVASQVLIALGNCGFKAGISQITNIKYAIEGDIEDIAWNLAAIGEVSTEHFGEEIIHALEEENNHDINHIYMLLSMLYDSQSIQLVKDNIESGTNEGVSFAVELLDVFLSDDLKQRIIPVMDDMPAEDKFRKLEIFYPRPQYENKEVLKLLVNREFNQTNHWTKACVIYQIGLMKIDEFMFDLIAHLFNPDPLLNEIAAWSIYHINQEAYHINSVRIDTDVKRKLDEVILSGRDELLKFNKIRFLKGLPMFRGIQGLILSELADFSDYIFLSAGNSIVLSKKNNYNFYLVYKGTATIIKDKGNTAILKEGDFLGEIFTRQGIMGNVFIKAESDVVLLKFYKDTFYDYLADHVNLAEKVVNEI